MDSISKVITIWPSPDAVIDAFSVVCSGDTVQINSSSLGNSLSTSWQLFEVTNGVRKPRSDWLSTTLNAATSLWIPSWSYPNVYSIYTLKLTTTNAFGCIDSTIQTFTVRAKPTVDFSPISGGCGPWTNTVTAIAQGPTGRTFNY